MYLTEISHLPSFSPRRAFGKRSQPKDFDIVARSFDENVLRRLKLLSPPSISLSWLSKAVDFLSFTHTESKNLISNLKSSSSGGSFDVYLNYSVKLLDICNLITSEIEKLRQRRLLVSFVLHLVQSSGADNTVPPLEKLRRARDSLSDWERNSLGTEKRGRFQIHDPESLIRELASELSKPPHGKVSRIEKLIRRSIHAVLLITVFVAGAVLSALHGWPMISKVRAPAEFLWAESFNSLELATIDELNRRISVGERKKDSVYLDEIDDVAISVSTLREIVDRVVLGNKSMEAIRENLDGAVKDLETVTNTLSQDLDDLANGVNGIFHSVLGTRNGLLDDYRADATNKHMK